MSGLEEWIQLMETKGYSEKQLEEYLVKEGYNRDDIDSILKGVRKTRPSSLNTLWIILSVVVLVVLAVVVMNYYGTFDGMLHKNATLVPNNTAAPAPRAVFGRANTNLTNSSENLTSDNTTGNGNGNLSLNSSSNITSSANSNITKLCGNGVIDGDEQCDGRDFGGKYCWDIVSPSRNSFNGGALQCNDDCTINTSGCTYCGDGIISSNVGEQCENINGVLFSTLVFNSKNNPHEWDLSKTDPCLNFGYASGKVYCDSSCRLNTSGCYNKIDATCGNGILEGNELCDYGIQGPANASTCKNYSYTGSCPNNVTGNNDPCQVVYRGGTILCTSECTQDFSGCTK